MRTCIKFLVAMIAVIAIASGVLYAQSLVTSRYVGQGYRVETPKLRLINKVHYGSVDSADHVMYNPTTGTIVVGITRHPQRSGHNGAVIAPGDCWNSFETGFSGATTFLVADLDGNGQENDVLLHRQSDGLWREYKITLALFPGCDTSDAF